MPVFNFQKQFKPSILSGRKISTIRAKRKGQPGERAILWTGNGFFKDERLGEAYLTTVKQITLFADFEMDELEICLERSLTQDSTYLAVLNKDDALNVALNEGFQSLDEMKLWFRLNQELPFRGFLHTWDKLK